MFNIVFRKFSKESKQEFCNMTWKLAADDGYLQI